MNILTLRTEKPEAELGYYEDTARRDYQVWLAHRQLAETLHAHIADLLSQHGKTIHDIEGIVIFQGPGSFTGLRIGLTVANTLADSLVVPVVATQGEDWLEQGIARLQTGDNDWPALPFYGADAHITAQKK